MPRAIYSHARVVKGPSLYIAGQTPLAQDGSVAEDIGGQTRGGMGKIEAILLEHRLGLQDLVKLTYFLTDIQDLPAFREAMDAVLPVLRPTASLVEVKALIDPRFRVEIEAIAEFKDMLP